MRIVVVCLGEVMANSGERTALLCISAQCQATETDHLLLIAKLEVHAPIILSYILQVKVTLHIGIPHHLTLIP